jgi:protein-disulfide isomerase
MSTKQPPKSNTPMFIIGAVLLVALGGGFWFYTSSKGVVTKGNTNTNSKDVTPAKVQTIPPNAPPGAQPPNETGSPTARVTLEEFADFQCGSCAAEHPTMNEIKSMYGTRIHFIFRNFPLKIPAHDKSYDAAIAAEAAGAQGKFWEMQNMLFTHQQDWTKAPTFRDIWKGYAQTIGLNVPKWEADISGIGPKGRVNEDMERGNACNINSTPTLFINGTAVPFASMTVDGIKAIVDAELQKGSGAPPSNTESKAPGGEANSTK